MTLDIPTVTLLGPAMVPLVVAASALQTSNVPPFAVIGGVAVTVRLGRVIRATTDLDTVTDYRVEPTALEILRRRDDTVYDPAQSHTIFIGGSQVQFQDVAPLTDADVEHLEGKQLLYVTAHAHALESATPIRILAIYGDEQTEAVVPVAAAGALIAMKLHAYLDRNTKAGIDKRSGDLWDIYNLLLFLAQDASADLNAGGRRLRYAVRATVTEYLIDGAARARAVLRTSNDERYQAITADEIAHAAIGFLSRLDDH